MTVAIRDATVEDLPAITDLFNALIPTTTTTYREHLADGAEMTAWWDAQAAAGRPVLVAEAGETVVGYATWSAFRSGDRLPGYRHTAELTVHVDGTQHGRGVGRRLMDALIDRAEAEGVHVLVAAVDAENEGSIAFHQRLGFVEVGRMPEVGRKFDRWLTLVLLQRIVGPR